MIKCVRIALAALLIAFAIAFSAASLDGFSQIAKKGVPGGAPLVLACVKC
jgi:hypothetical protein